ncbi:MAG: hypothetical protein M3Q40_09660 [Pseudomonadota bacterium]|nr:hypothetical protein [Pseudomonadota bacterium]
MTIIHPRSTVLPGIIAAVLGAMSAGHVDVAKAATLAVGNCNDSGPGSLRQAVGLAASGDTVDLTSLACNRIILTGGAVDVPQRSLTVRGPGFNRLAVSGNYASSVFRHSGTGLLRLRGMALEHGRQRGAEALGGCVYSAGAVEANDMHVRHCGAYATTTFAMGGGIYARGGVKLLYSAVFANAARGPASYGGGVWSGADLVVHRARLLKNVAGEGGGAFASDGLKLSYAAVEGNRAFRNGGGVSSYHGSYGAQILNSTVSGNTAGTHGGGLSLNSSVDKMIISSTISGNTAASHAGARVNGNTTFANSTLAFNDNVNRSACDGAVDAYGVLYLESTIAASNTCNGAPSLDIHGDHPAFRVEGSNNLVTASNVALPADTISADPLLEPLAANGGRTRTHALLGGSQAIDRGNNAAGLAYDQRGQGYPRTNGARADIGALER